MHILCENIRALRRELGMTQKELAEKLDISDKTVSRWESGVQLPEASLLPGIAEALNTNIDRLYGVEKEPDAVSDPPTVDSKKAVFAFRTTMIAGALISLFGSLLYRYFGSAVFLKPNIVDVAYYNTAKGATADIFAFIGIAAVFAGIAAVIIAKVRFSMQFKPYMSDAIFAENVRCTGAVIVVYAILFMKTAPEILSFGFYVSREVYGYIFVAALTAALLWYKRQLRKREIAVTKAATVISLSVGGVGVALSAAAHMILNDMPMLTSDFDPALSAAAAVMITVGELMIPAMPLILYIELLIKLRKIKS